MKAKFLPSAFLAAAAAVAGCAPQPPSVTARHVPVAGGSLFVDVLGMQAGVCDVRIRGASVTNWVKANGALPRMTLAPAVVEACIGRRPYLASVSSTGENGAVVWEESSGPDSGTTLTSYSVLITDLREDEARLTLRVGR